MRISLMTMTAAFLSITLSFGEAKDIRPQQSPMPQVLSAVPTTSCTTSNGLWGTGDMLEVKIERLPNGTAQYFVKMLANNHPWQKSSTFSTAAGGTFSVGTKNFKAEPEGDGYRVSVVDGSIYHWGVHFHC